MTSRAVHWHEGMFLRPQHFQAAGRHTLYVANQSEKWDQHYNWGLRTLDLDREALTNHRLVIRSLKARLRDGTLIAIPEDGVLTAVDLKTALEGRNSLMAYVGVPVFQPGRANVAGNGRVEQGRYVLDMQEVEDENTGVNPQPVQVRLLNVKLLLETQDLGGYEVVPIARLKKSDRPDAPPEIDETYIPPVLACDAWPGLAAGILENIYDRIGARLDFLTRQVASRGIVPGTQAPDDALILGLLAALNEGSAILNVFAFAQGIHPLPAYLELCRLVGRLALFGKDPGRRVPDLPRYDHDDLGGCFLKVKHYLDTIDPGEPEYTERPFEGIDDRRLQVAMDRDWLQTGWQMFVGVKTALQPEETVKLLRPGQLDMKIAAADRVDQVFVGGWRGLEFTHTPLPPRALPVISGQ
ncbi:MAG TPA: type VI secretion system baseplate subunit TssK, partial [Gemmataceae bacterium]|nr:type VI secretion system baseplate subunit TssK [Gemmataceae bacterium]